tara:strand:- start:8653 stop:8865 length:213 start_codon:yes stop_codon:yes gene_type:complete
MMIKRINIKIETVITIVILIIGAGVAYGSLTTRVTELENKTDMILQMSIDISVIKEKVSNIENTINNSRN